MPSNINTVNSLTSGRFTPTYYDRQLLESAKTKLVFAEFGQKRSVPRNSGNKVNFRRWNLFDPHDALLGLE